MHVAILWNINTETVKSEWYFTYYKLTIADIRSVMDTGRGVETTRLRGNWRIIAASEGASCHDTKTDAQFSCEFSRRKTLNFTQ